MLRDVVGAMGDWLRRREDVIGWDMVMDAEGKVPVVFSNHYLDLYVTAGRM